MRLHTRVAEATTVVGLLLLPLLVVVTGSGAVRAPPEMACFVAAFRRCVARLRVAAGGGVAGWAACAADAYRACDDEASSLRAAAAAPGCARHG
ncbi:hypothetical protein ACP70R_019012 [Stipagrostis hirtigluma subsp. patula]